MSPECAAPGAVWIAFAVGVFLVGVPAGVTLTAILAAGGHEDVAREAYQKGMQDSAEAARQGMHEAFNRFGERLEADRAAEEPAA